MWEVFAKKILKKRNRRIITERLAYIIVIIKYKVTDNKKKVEYVTVKVAGEKTRVTAKITAEKLKFEKAIAIIIVKTISKQSFKSNK